MKRHIVDNIYVPAAQSKSDNIGSGDMVHYVYHTIISGEVETLDVMTMCGQDVFDGGLISNDKTIVTCPKCLDSYKRLIAILRRPEEEELRRKQDEERVQQLHEEHSSNEAGISFDVLWNKGSRRSSSSVRRPIQLEGFVPRSEDSVE